MRRIRTIEGFYYLANGRFIPIEPVVDLKKRTFIKCNICKFHNFKRPYDIFTTGVDGFCMACNKIKAKRKSWVYADEVFSKVIPKFENQLLIAAEIWREDLPGYKNTNRKLTVDAGVFYINKIQMPIAVFEFKTSEPAKQDNGADYYNDKRKYYKSRKIPFFVINYSADKEASTICLERVLQRVLDFYLNEINKDETFEEWFPYENILLY